MPKRLRSVLVPGLLLLWAAAGMRVAAGEPLALGTRLELFADGLLVDWLQGCELRFHERDLAALAGQAVRLRFVMRDADLFALRFR